jgi:hypothetical protein
MMGYHIVLDSHGQSYVESPKTKTQMVMGYSMTATIAMIQLIILVPAVRLRTVMITVRSYPIPTRTTLIAMVSVTPAMMISTVTGYPMTAMIAAVLWIHLVPMVLLLTVTIIVCSFLTLIRPIPIMTE